MITLKSPREIEKMREAGSIVARAFEVIRSMVKPGVRTIELDRAVKETIVELGGEPAFYGYRGFPGNICVSINEEVVHGIPGNRRLKEGDIVSVDIGVKRRGYFGDAAITLPVGTVSEEAEKLLQVCREALDLAVARIRPNERLSTISRTIQEHAEGRG